MKLLCICKDFKGVSTEGNSFPALPCEMGELRTKRSRVYLPRGSTPAREPTNAISTVNRQLVYQSEAVTHIREKKVS